MQILQVKLLRQEALIARMNGLRKIEANRLLCLQKDLELDSPQQEMWQQNQ